MGNTASHRLAILSLAGLAFSIPTYPDTEGNASVALGLFPRQDDGDEWDPSNLSHIKKLAAIGDSYSAGIGAGNRLGNVFGIVSSQSDWSCSRYDHSYPYLISEDPVFGVKKPQFQFLSCSGALADDVLEKQIPNLNKDQQAIMLSVGGNDAELVNILNHCVYQWAVVSPEQAMIAKEAAARSELKWLNKFDWDTLSRGCMGQLSHTQKIIDGKEFSNKIDRVLEEAKKKLAPDGMIYYTGYAKFFAEDLTDACDKVSWSTWIYKAANLFRPDEKLIKGHRQRMNDLVDAVNGKIEEAVKRAGDKVKFVNYDKYVGDFNGRFCEKGVDEASKESNGRPGLMFYELNTQDPFGNTPWKRSPGGEPQGTFAGSLDTFAQITLLLDKDAIFSMEKANEGQEKPSVAMAVNQASVPLPIGGLLNQVEIPNILPDGYGRIFHPTILLHMLIANLVIFEMINTNVVRNKLPPIPKEIKFTSCSAPPASVARAKEPACDLNGIVSGFPENLFRDRVFNEFCEEVEKDVSKSVQWKVDRDGKQVNKKRSISIAGRTPPPPPASSGAYKDYRINLKWSPKKGSAKCPMKCDKALTDIATSACGHMGARANHLLEKSKHDIGCGTYEVAVDIPGSHPTISEKCFPKNRHGKHLDVHAKNVKDATEWFCKERTKYWQKMKPGDPPIIQGFRVGAGGSAPWDAPRGVIGNVKSDMRFEISREENCKHDDVVNILDPMGTGVTCEMLLLGRYEDCYNGGGGGHVTANCIRYEFSPYVPGYNCCK